MVKWSCLNRFISGGLPCVRVESVFKVKHGSANHIITKDVVFIHDINDKSGASWKNSTKFNLLIEIWIRFIVLVFVFEALHLVTKGDLDIWV